MTDQFNPTRREPFDDPVTGDQTVPTGQSRDREAGGDVAATQAANAGTVPGLPGEIFAKPDPDQPVEGRRDQPETDKALDAARGREADADEATLGH